MRVLKNNTDQDITFYYGGIEYNVLSGQLLQADELVIDHYVKSIGGETRLDVIDVEMRMEPQPELSVSGNTDLSGMSWNDLRKLATSKGVAVFGRPRAEVEQELSAL